MEGKKLISEKYSYTASGAPVEVIFDKAINPEKCSITFYMHGVLFPVVEVNKKQLSKIIDVLTLAMNDLDDEVKKESN